MVWEQFGEGDHLEHRVETFADCDGPSGYRLWKDACRISTNEDISG
jgi:hypothetical protein